MKDRLTDIIIQIFFHFKSMPIGLRIITISCFLGTGFAGTIFPFMKFHMNETEVTYFQYWASGAGFEQFSLGIMLFFSGLGIYFKKNWSKGLLLIVLAVYGTILPAIHSGAGIGIDAYISAIILIGPLTCYFYYKNSVQDYFNV